MDSKDLSFEWYLIRSVIRLSMLQRFRDLVQINENFYLIFHRNIRWLLKGSTQHVASTSCDYRSSREATRIECRIGRMSLRLGGAERKCWLWGLHDR